MFLIPTPRTSSSAVETEITGRFLEFSPESVNCFQNATFESPLIVWKTASGLASLILLIVVAYSVLPSGEYSSPTISMLLAFAHALISLFAVRGKT
jgi:hypothetical protein